MKAFRLESFNAPLRLESVETPKPGPDEIVIRVQACGVCGTDLKIISGSLPPEVISLPHTPGHEIAGEVVEVGSAVKNISIGDRGVAYIYIVCRDCEMCRTGNENVCFNVQRLGFELPGGFAEYVKMPAYNFCPIDSSQPIENMVVLTDAALTAYHAVQNLAQVKSGETVLIVGSGGLGSHAVQFCKLAGARTIVADRRDSALEMARRFGADETINSERCAPLEAIHDLTGGKGVEVVIEIVGSEATLQWSIRALKRRGRLALTGYDPLRPAQLPTLEMHYNEWFILGTRHGLKQELLEIISMAEQKRISPVVSATFPWKQANDVLEKLKQQTEVGRMVLTFDDE